MLPSLENYDDIGPWTEVEFTPLNLKFKNPEESQVTHTPCHNNSQIQSRNKQLNSNNHLQFKILQQLNEEQDYENVEDEDYFLLQQQQQKEEEEEVQLVPVVGKMNSPKNKLSQKKIPPLQLKRTELNKQSSGKKAQKSIILCNQKALKMPEEPISAKLDSESLITQVQSETMLKQLPSARISKPHITQINPKENKNIQTTKQSIQIKPIKKNPSHPYHSQNSSYINNSKLKSEYFSKQYSLQSQQSTPQHCVSQPYPNNNNVKPSNPSFQCNNNSINNNINNGNSISVVNNQSNVINSNASNTNNSNNVNNSSAVNNGVIIASFNQINGTAAGRTQHMIMQWIKNRQCLNSKNTFLKLLSQNQSNSRQAQEKVKDSNHPTNLRQQNLIFMAKNKANSQRKSDHQTLNQLKLQKSQLIDRKIQLLCSNQYKLEQKLLLEAKLQTEASTQQTIGSFSSRSQVYGQNIPKYSSIIQILLKKMKEQKLVISSNVTSPKHNAIIRQPTLCQLPLQVSPKSQYASYYKNLQTK